MSFFEGAVSYAEIKTMPLPELLALQEQANIITKERKRDKNGN